MLVVAIGTLPAQTPADSSKEIATIREQWVTNWNAKRLDLIVKLYGEHAVLLPSTGQRIEGRDAIGSYLKQLMDSSTGNLTVNSVSAEESDKLAFDSGTLQDAVKVSGGVVMRGGVMSGGVIAGGGGQRQVTGNYLVVLKHGPDRKWLIEQHAFTEVPPAK